MNLLQPKATMVTSDDPRAPWIVLAHEGSSRRALKIRRAHRISFAVFAGIAAAAFAFVFIPRLTTALWAVSVDTTQSSFEAAVYAQDASPKIVTIGGNRLPHALPGQPSVARTSPPASIAASPATAAESARTAGARLVIPKIGVNMAIVKGENERALLLGAWLSPWGSTPDLGGNTTIFGHRYLRLYPDPRTFHALDRLTLNDTFEVQWQGKAYQYRVVETKVVPPTEVSVMAPTSRPSVTLITCTPVFTTKNRLVVRGELL